jgi:hypothetical protein
MCAPAFKPNAMAIYFIRPDKTYWRVGYKGRNIEKIQNQEILYMNDQDAYFDTFAEAQSYLLILLKQAHAEAVADIARLSAELTQIESKIRIINTSTEQDYTG